MSGLNLIRDAWIPTDRGVATPAEALLAGTLTWPRADFRAASMQFLIGLTQTAVNKPSFFFSQ